MYGLQGKRSGPTRLAGAVLSEWAPGSQAGRSLTSGSESSIVRAMRTWAGGLVLGLVLGVASSAQAYFLGGNRNVDLRARVYSQLGIIMDDAEKDQPPRCSSDDLPQHSTSHHPPPAARLAARVAR